MKMDPGGNKHSALGPGIGKTNTKVGHIPTHGSKIKKGGRAGHVAPDRRHTGGISGPSGGGTGMGKVAWGGTPKAGK